LLLLGESCRWHLCRPLSPCSSRSHPLGLRSGPSLQKDLGQSGTRRYEGLLSVLVSVVTVVRIFIRALITNTSVDGHSRITAIRRNLSCSRKPSSLI
jgi:hypothetical protein